ncbi:MAG: hypothetical protein M3P33_02915 [bacterium]|nr:hypothetical protein [bacterium]
MLPQRERIVSQLNEKPTEEISKLDPAARRLVDHLSLLPDEAFAKLQYLQPQVGCFNRCAFCSQSAGSDIWQFTEKGLADLFIGLRTAIDLRFPERIELGQKIGFERRSHRPGVLFPYLDNDIASYPYLDTYIKLATAELGAQV